jgi:hypothetical protein
MLLGLISHRSCTTDIPFWEKDKLRRQNFAQGQAAQGQAAGSASSSRAGSDPGPASRPPRKPATSPAREPERRQPPREPNCTDSFCQAACAGSTACKPCGQRPPPATRLLALR